MLTTSKQIVFQTRACTRTALCVLLLGAGSLQLSAQRQELRRHIPGGVALTTSSGTLEITALRDDALRVRLWQGSTQPEDASWAIVPDALHQRAEVTYTESGFSTGKLQALLNPDLTLTVKDAQGNVLQEDASPLLHRGHSFRVYKKKTRADHFFGLGDKPGPLDRSGEAFTLWSTDHFGWQESTDPIYKSIPFFLRVRGSAALGVLFNNTYRSFFDFGRENEGEYSFGAENGACDYVLLYGPTPREVLTGYAWLTGPTPLPPLWALGFQQSRYTYSPEADLTEVQHRLRADHIPSDVLWLDIDFQRKNMPFTVDPDRFPQFPELVKSLADDHFRLVVITDLHIADQPNLNYAPYDSGVQGDHFVKLPNGQAYVGTVWPGPSVFPDFTRASTEQWWGSLYKDFMQEGVAGFWNDMNEPSVFGSPTRTMPDNVLHRIERPGFRTRTTDHREIHNVYGMLNSEGTYKGMLANKPNERPFVMTRASFAGGQRYAVTWTGDNSATWNHLRLSTPQLMNLGLSGFSLAGADVGGFAGSPPADLLTKWTELSAFQPIDRNHSGKDTRRHEVWVDGPEQENIRRRYIEERYRLLPYIYTTAEHTSHDGIPMMRPLFVEFPTATSDGHPVDLDAGGSEFLLGTDILVAPNPSPEEVAPYQVHLPPGVWYDYWTGERFEQIKREQARDLEQPHERRAKAALSITPSLETLPVYVRGGSIVPYQPLVQSTAETPVGPLTLRVYLSGDATKPCSGEVYADDGHSFNYRQGEYARIAFTCDKSVDGSLRVTIAPQKGSYKPWWSEYKLQLFGWTPTQRTATADQAYTLEASGVSWSVTFPAKAAGSTVVLR